MRRIALPALLALTTTACAAVGPNYAEPKLATPAGFTEASGPSSVVTGDAAALKAWWTQFQDSELNRLVERALAGNLDLQAAASHIRQARQQAVIAGAKALPSVTATGAGLHIARDGPDSGSGSDSGGFQIPDKLTMFSAGFDATWEADVFGGVRRAVEAARASAQAAEWAQRDGEVSLTAEVANDYLTYRALQAQITALTAALKSQTDMLDLVRARARHGVVTQLDVNQQNTQLATLRATIPQLEAQARAQVHALGVLLGQAPEALDQELAAAAPIPAIPATLPIGLPSDLLRRRPDLREAERQLASATANVGVAVADLYPKFNLIGALSLSSSKLPDLVTNPALTAVGVGLIQWPIFQGGRIRANIAVNEEKRTQAYLAYQQAVLGAVRDVEDALARYAAEQRRNLALQQSKTAATSTLTIARDQYGHGLTNYLNVLTSQQSLQQIDQQLAASDGQVTQNLVSLYKALGGGWAEG